MYATRVFYLYGYSFSLNDRKTVESFTLPPNPQVLVFAITLVRGLAGDGKSRAVTLDDAADSQLTS